MPGGGLNPDGPGWEYVDIHGEHWYERFANGGVRVHWAAAFGGGGGRDPDGDYEIKDQSFKSRMRAAFELKEAQCRWGWMFTATYPLDNLPAPDELKADLRKFERAVHRRYGCALDAWFMEFTRNGAPHYHIFIAEESSWGAVLATMPTEHFPRRYANGRWKSARDVVRGSADNWLVQTWTGIIGDRRDETMAFQRGGICERMRFPDAAGRYAAKEASKRAQKNLPDAYAQGVGRWWWLNEKWKKRRVETGPVEIRQWSHERPLAYVWDEKTVADSLVPGASEPGV